MCAIRHDGGRNDGQSAGTEYDEHDHGVAGLGFVSVERLKFAHCFEPHRSGCIVEPEHVGCEIHEHRAIDGVIVRYLGENATKERCNTAREGVDYSALLTDVENTHPEGEYAGKTEGNLKTILGRGEGGVENFGENIGLPKGKKLYAAHDDC